jgi:hypothetical protein
VWTVLFLAASVIFVLSLYTVGAILIFAPLMVQLAGLFALGLALLQITIFNLEEGVLRAFLVNVSYNLISTAVLTALGAGPLMTVIIGVLLFSLLNAIYAENDTLYSRRREYA